MLIISYCNYLCCEYFLLSIISICLFVLFWCYFIISFIYFYKILKIFIKFIVSICISVQLISLNSENNCKKVCLYQNDIVYLYQIKQPSKNKLTKKIMETRIIDFKGTQKQAEKHLTTLYNKYPFATQISCINMPLFTDFGVYTFKIITDKTTK